MINIHKFSPSLHLKNFKFLLTLLNKDTKNLMRNINNILRKNYRILEKLNPEEKTKTSKTKLLAEGFNFQYFTSTYTTQAGKTYYFIYNFIHKFFRKTNIKKSEWKMYLKKSKLTFPEFSILYWLFIFYWLFQRFSGICWSKKIETKVQYFFKINFRHEKLLAFIQKKFSYKIWMYTIEKCHLPL